MARALRSSFVLLAALAALTACTVKDTKAPALSGPSELGLSLTLQASPDVLTQDGSSQSQLLVIARDANAQPVRNLTCRVDIAVDGVIADFGELSTRTVTTGSDGRATLQYTAPPPPLAVTGAPTTVALVVTPVGTDFSNDVPRLVTIRLVPAGVVIPPSQATAGFSYSPETPGEADTVAFDGSNCTSDTAKDCSRGAIGWTWDFGDGRTASGPVVTHRYGGGTYSVTLTVADGQGRAASTTRVVTVAVSEAPIAGFALTPTSPKVAENTVLDASSSSAATGRRIVSYQWSFGDGTTSRTSAPFANHAWGTAGSFPVMLTVADDLGHTGQKVIVVTVTP